MFVFSSEAFRRPKLAVVQPIILRQFDSRLKPELRFAVRAVHVDVHARLLAGKEEKPEAVFAEDGRAHAPKP